MPKHIPVLTREVIEALRPGPNQNFIDATCGFGGHSQQILRKTEPAGKLLAIDQDLVALEEAKLNLKNYLNRVTFFNSNFRELGLIIRAWKVEEINGILFDLGVSTYQLKGAQKGFSFLEDSFLDMRMSAKNPVTAEKLINKLSFKELKTIIKEYGEEPNAGRIASEIVEARKNNPIQTTSGLVDVISRGIPEKFKHGKTHFATKTFQALRIAVNDELGALESGLKQAYTVLSPGGRIAVISFHSLEDRIVKRFFTEKGMEIITKQPIVPSLKEVENNPSSRSAKLRAAKKI